MKEPSIIDLLRDPDPETRSEAFEELSLEMDDALAASILDLVESDAPEDVRADAVIALGPVVEECGDEYFEGAVDFGPELGPPISRDAYTSLSERVRAVYEDESQPKLLRRRAFETLVRDPKEWQKEEIRRHAASGDREWTLTAVFGMGYVPGFDSELQQLVATESGDILGEAIRAAASMEVEVAERVRRLARSAKTDRAIRLEAIRALPTVDPDARDILDELEGSRDEEIAAAAHEALDELDLYGGDLDF